MDLHIRKINRNLVIGWLAIVGSLFVAYIGEVIKEERSLQYLLAYLLVAGMPALAAVWIYRKKPEWYGLRYYIIFGYFFLYLFSILTEPADLVFTYIIPLLFLLVLYHQPRLILYTGVASLAVNLIRVCLRFVHGEITKANSWNSEIQLGVLVLCFFGAYMAARLYDQINHENISYTRALDEKNNQIQLMTLQTVTTIVNTIDAKDEYTKGHSRRVSEYAGALARELKMPEEKIREVEVAALLHDIGKIGVPDAVLNKPGKLTDTEYELMKQHTTIGGEILKDIRMIPGIDIGAKYHHEWYDGTGYPRGLKGEEIPFVARIIAVADTYDAMTSTRVYRRYLDDAKVIREIKGGIGKQFDPVPGEAMVRLLEEGRLENISPDRNKSGEESEIERILNRFLEEQRNPTRENQAFDELTGVYNKSHGEELLKAAVDQRQGVLCLFDLDRFRLINETIGYVTGDVYLRVVADTIRELSEELIISRVSGAEFVVLIRNAVTQAAAEELFELFQKKIAEKKAEDATLEKLSVSIGAVMLGYGELQSFHELFRKADKALYYAKQQGGGAYSFHEEEEEAAGEQDMAEVDLQQLVHNIKGKESYRGGFQVAYPEFARIYEYVKNIVERNNQQVQILLFTVVAKNGIHVSVEERDRVMEYLERAIIQSIRTVDVTTKYSSTQRIVLLMALSEERTHIVTERIMKEFYRMYDRGEVLVRCNTADLSKLESV